MGMEGDVLFDVVGGGVEDGFHADDAGVVDEDCRRAKLCVLI
jgi:hypothetical protein